MRIFVKPTNAEVCPLDLLTMQPIAAAGAFVPNDDYWQRRIADGDVVEAEPPPPAASAAVAEAAAPAPVPAKSTKKA